MRKPIIVAVVGSKRSGKTTTVETLTKELTSRGYRVAAVKHIHKPDFTIDREGKDTWRFAQAGARTVIAVGTNEVVTIEKVQNENHSLKEILQKCKGNDIVFLEGFRNLVRRNRNIRKVIVVKSAEEAQEAVKNFHPLLAFTGPYSTDGLNLKIPYVDALRKPSELADLLERAIKKSG